jgi:hypothetical protein
MDTVDISRTLFFSDVPDGALKHKPVVRTGAVDLTGIVSNLGKDIHNALFFDDLQSVCSQQKEPCNPYVQQGDPKDAFKPLEELKEDDPQPWPTEPFVKLAGRKKSGMLHEELKEEFDDLVEDEEAHEMYCRGKTIPPPSLGRIQKINEDVALSKRQAELLQMALRR